MKALTSAEILAVVKVLADQATKASAGLEVGEHEVDVTVRVRGSLTKGGDYKQRIANKVDTWLLLGVALSKLNGATAESVVREAIAIEESAKGEDLAKQVKAAAGEAILRLKGTTETPCKGKVTHELSAEPVEAAGAGEADAA